MTSSEAAPRGFLDSVRQTLRDVVQLARSPRLEVKLVLPAGGPPPGDTQLAAYADTVARAISAHAEALGVPVQPEVEVSSTTDHGQRRPALFFTGRPARPPTDAAEALAVRSLDGVWRHDDGRRPEALAILCRVVLEQDPRVLVGPLQRDALVQRARQAGLIDYDDSLVAAAVQYIVGHGVSVRDLAPLVAALRRQDDIVQTAGELAEIAVDVLRPQSIEIRLRKSTLRAVTAGGVEQDAFVDMRRRMFTDVGVNFPDIDLNAAEDVPEGACALRLNHVSMQPRRLPERASVADLAAFVERWLRRYASWFVSLAEVRRTVGELKLALPELVGIVQERHSNPRLALLARALVEERVAVRNAARLMTLLLDTPSAGRGRDVVRFAEPLRGTATENDGGQCPRQLVSYARQQMNEESARLTPGIATVDAMPLPPDLEAALDAVKTWDGIVPGDVPAHEVARLTALADRLALRGDATLVAATQHSRAVAASLLVSQYPEITVVAADEYPPSYRLSDPAPS